MTTSTSEQREIHGISRSVRELLKGMKYSIDYYQREYKWQSKQVEELLDDLTACFLEDHDDANPREAVASYRHYFLGSIVVSNKGGQKFLIDGQQRLTTLTLLLIYLHNLQRERKDRVDVADMIFSVKYGKKSFNLDVPERQAVMEALFTGAEFDPNGQLESVRNIYARDLTEAHRRIRKAVRLRVQELTVEAQWPLDLLGVLVLESVT